MNPPDIFEVTLKVIRVFEKLNIAYYVRGSLASSAFGMPRTTIDTDIVANIKPEQVFLLEELLKNEFYIDADMVHNAIRYQSSFNIIHTEMLFKVDIFILKERPFDCQALSRRVQKTVSADTSQKIFFASPEDVILSKLEWYKMGGEVSDRQWNDILGILKVQGTQLDMPYLNQWAKGLGISALLKKALDEAGMS